MKRITFVEKNIYAPIKVEPSFAPKEALISLQFYNIQNTVINQTNLSTKWTHSKLARIDLLWAMGLVTSYLKNLLHIQYSNLSTMVKFYAIYSVFCFPPFYFLCMFLNAKTLSYMSFSTSTLWIPLSSKKLSGQWEKTFKNKWGSANIPDTQ